MSSVALERPAPWRAGLHSARVNLAPGLVLQAGALALVVAYYHHAPTQAVLARLTAWRAHATVVFPILSTGLFGGLLPFLYLRSRAETRHRYTWPQGLAITAFWAYKGFEIDLLYRLLARFVGLGHDVATIAAKTTLDQLIYCPIFAVPVTVLAYDWVEARFDRHAIAADLRAGGWYRRRVLPMLISNLGVWVPAVCIIYSFPTPLQLPLQNVVLCFFTLMLAHLSRQPR